MDGPASAVLKQPLSGGGHEGEIEAAHSRVGGSRDLDAGTDRSPCGRVGGTKEREGGGTCSGSEVGDARVVAHVETGLREQRAQDANGHGTQRDDAGKPGERRGRLFVSRTDHEEPGSSRAVITCEGRESVGWPVLRRRAAAGMNAEEASRERWRGLPRGAHLLACEEERLRFPGRIGPERPHGSRQPDRGVVPGLRVGALREEARGEGTESLDQIGAVGEGESGVRAKGFIQRLGVRFSRQEAGDFGTVEGRERGDLGWPRTDQHSPWTFWSEDADTVARATQRRHGSTQEKHVAERAGTHEEHFRHGYYGTSTRPVATLPSRSETRSTTTWGPAVSLVRTLNS